MLPDLTPAAGHHRVMVVVAHPDDETFGCGSLLLRSAAAGATTAVCCATRGEAGQPSPVVGTGPDVDLGSLRETELRAAARTLGVSEVALLGFGDSGMSGAAPEASLAGADMAEVVAAVRRTVVDFRPDALVTLDAGDGHRDHERVRDATTSVAHELGLPVYLHCLPRSLMSRWVDHMNQARPDTEHLSLGELGTPDHEVDLVLDTSAHLARREAAIAAHRSQTSPFEGLPDDLRRAFLTADHLRLIDPPGATADETGRTGRVSAPL